jgi:hypothetical protein
MWTSGNAAKLAFSRDRRTLLAVMAASIVLRTSAGTYATETGVAGRA